MTWHIKTRRIAVTAPLPLNLLLLLRPRIQLHQWRRRGNSLRGAPCCTLQAGCLGGLGDALLALLVSDPLWLARLQTLKGWLYVLLTAALAWWLLLRAQRAEAKHGTLAQELALVARHAPRWHGSGGFGNHAHHLGQ